ncbi:MAG: MBOAT family protein [Spartobacteria bacterium]|nr:MBOAT family protein [Spartobacteria bacterium]
MVFSSITFLFFFLPLVLLVYFVIPRRGRNAFLLVSSLIFYIWGEGWFVLLMLASSALDYLCGWIIFGQFRQLPRDERGNLPKRRTKMQRIALIASLVGNLGMLGFFKYFNFFTENYNALVSMLGLTSISLKYVVTIGLPLGISFYTFQSMSYTIDIYRGTVEATRHPINFACFVTMFPQLVAGPIVRYRDVARELAHRHIHFDDFAAGVRLFLIGLAKKVLVANILAEPADQIYAMAAEHLPCSVAWLGAILFPLQLYFDFSGYSDMAIGMGRMFGFHFPRNFNYPFISRTAVEFWARWHITLSQWLRDYVFVSMGGYRCSRKRAFFNLVFTFFLCGLWHGASWNYILFGVIPGSLMVFERIVKANKRAFFSGRLVHLVYGFPMIVGLMVIFRTDNLAHAGRYLAAMAGMSAAPAADINIHLYLNPEVWLVMACAIIGSMPFIPWLRHHFDRWAEVSPRWLGAPVTEWIRQVGMYILLMALLVLCAMKLAAGTYNPFIYFKF